MQDVHRRNLLQRDQKKIGLGVDIVNTSNDISVKNVVNTDFVFLRSFHQKKKKKSNITTKLPKPKLQNFSLVPISSAVAYRFRAIFIST